jgi:hypothetical protein
MDERVRRAGLLCERAVFTGDAGPLAEADRELDAAEADLAVARGRLMHTRFLLRRDQDPAAAEEDPGELPLFECAAGCTRRSVMFAARPRRFSGSAVSIRSSGTTTLLRSPPGAVTDAGITGGRQGREV